MKSESKAFISELLNAYWDSAVNITNIDLLDVELDELCTFIKNNRIEGYVYSTLRGQYDDTQIAKFCKSLFDRNLVMYKKNMLDIRYVVKCLKGADSGYALINGSYAIPFLCKPGERIQRDIDLCVNAGDYEKIQGELIKNGFSQSIVENGRIRKANRLEIKYAYMNNSYIIPYFKEKLNNREVDIWVDIDIFSDDEIAFDSIIKKRVISKEQEVNCFDIETNLLYVCKNIFMKTKTYRYVEAKQDYVLGNFCQLNQMIWDEYDQISWERFERLAKTMSLENAVFYAFSVLKALFGKLYFKAERNIPFSILRSFDKDDPAFMNLVYDDKGNERYLYRCSYMDYLFAPNHEILLTKIK